MDASQIQALRAVIAASCEEEAPRTRRRGFARLFAPRDAAGGADDQPPAATKAAPVPHGGGAPAAASAFDIAADPLEEPLAQTLLVLGLGPRRAAFGQRREQVMALVDVKPTPSGVLRLTAPEDEALDDIGGRVASNDLASVQRHPYQAAAGEAPFFPEDLEDSPRRDPKTLTGGGEVEPPAEKSNDMKATFLLASLAARLAKEAAVLNARLASL